MPVTVFPNQSGSSGRAPRTPQPYVRARHPVPTNSPSQGIKQPTIPAFTTDPAWQGLAEDGYEISTAGKTLLQSTFTPTDSLRPVYDVTTDVPGHNRATSILWRFDPGKRKITEVARINWATSGKTMVEMGGVRVPATELLTKSKWRLGVSSPVSQTFTSEMEEYRWIPQPTLFSAESCSWQCVIPISRGTTAGSTILSVYTPSSLCKPLQPCNSDWISNRIKSTSSSSRRPSTSSGSTFVHQPRHGSLSGPGKRERQPALLEMYPGVNSKPHLREIVLLTAILVVVHKHEWKNLPQLWGYTTTPEAVLSRLSETHGPKYSPSNIPHRKRWSYRPAVATPVGTLPSKLSSEHGPSAFGGAPWS